MLTDVQIYQLWQQAEDDPDWNQCDVAHDPIPFARAIEQAILAAHAAPGGLTDEPVAQFAEDYIFNLRKQPNGERWPVGTKLYVHPAIEQRVGVPQYEQIPNAMSVAGQRKFKELSGIEPSLYEIDEVFRAMLAAAPKPEQQS